MPEVRLPAIADRAVWEKITKRRAGIRWDNVVEKVCKDLGGDQEEVLSIENFDRYNTEVTEKMSEMGILDLRNEVKTEKHFEIYGELREDNGMNTYLHGQMGYAKMLKLRFLSKGCGPTIKKKEIYQCSREEDVATNMCPCGTRIESRTHIVGECVIFKEERDALEETRKIDVCDMEEFCRLESSEKTIAILGDRWWPQTAKQDGYRVSM